MTTQAKAVLSVLLAVVISVAIYGAYQYPKAQVTLSASPAGSTFNTAKVAAVVANLSSTGSTGTTTSFLNNSGNSYYVTGATLGCDGLGTSKTAYTGAGLAALTFSIGTSSSANANTIGATAKVVNAATIATSTASFSTTTPFSGIGAAAVWHTGEYMTFQFNATNTAACTVGVTYLSS